MNLLHGLPLVMGCIDIYFHLLSAVNRLCGKCYLFVITFPPPGLKMQLLPFLSSRFAQLSIKKQAISSIPLRLAYPGASP
jgi:hypothetical protein